MAVGVVMSAAVLMRMALVISCVHVPALPFLYVYLVCYLNTFRR